MGLTCELLVRKAVILAPGDDDMIAQLDVDLRQRMHEFLRDEDILPTGQRAAARVVVREDEARGVVAQRGGDDSPA